MLPKAVTAAVFLAIPAFFGSIALSTEILEIIFGAEYAIASLALIVLMGEKVFQSAHKIFGYSLQAIDRPDLAAFAAIISLVANVVPNLSLIPLFGITGAALATATSFILNTALHVLFLSKHLQIRVESKKIVWCIFSATVMLLLLLLSKMFLSIVSIEVLLVYIILGAVFYFASVLSYSSLRIDILQLANRS